MTRGRERVFIGLGSNVGDRLRHIRAGVKAVGELPGTRVVKTSRVYDTSPVGPRQPRFLNATAEVRTSLPPLVFLKRLKALEKTLGRKKRRRMGPREIDLDLLLYGARRMKSRALTLPHPRMFRRKFVLKPLSDLAPGLRDPLSGRPLARLSRELTDPSQSIRLYRNVRRKTRA